MTTRIINLCGLTRGDTICFYIRGHGITQDATSLYFSVKKYKDDREYVFQESLGAGITQVEQGLYLVRIAPSKTENVDLGSYYYDVQLQFGEDTITAMKGKFELTYDITREEI